MIAWDDNSRHDFDICGTRINTAGVVLDTYNMITSNMAYYQYYSSVASIGEDHMVVWEDFRSNMDYDIYGARVDTNGTILDPNCVGISQQSHDQRYPDITSKDTHYFVVWEDSRYDSIDADIFGTRVDMGIVVDTFGIPISTAAGRQIDPAVTHDTNRYFVVWEDQRNGNSDIYGARINSEGINLDPEGIPIMINANVQVNPDISFDGTNYMVVWEEHDYVTYPLYIARIDTTGTILDSIPTKITTVGWNPAIAFDGSNYLIVWEQWMADYYYLFCTRINPSGVLLDTNGILIAENWRGWGPWNPAVDFDGTDYFVTWDWNGWGIHGALVSPNGTVDSVFVVTSLGDLPKIGSSKNGQMLITYSGWTDSINSHPANTMRIWGKFYPFTGIEEKASHPVSNALHTLKVFPNPFTAKTVITYSIIDGGYRAKNSSLRIYDVVGKLVRSFNLESSVVNYESNVIWDSRDDAGRELPPGVYFIQMKADNCTKTEKVILIK